MNAPPSLQLGDTQDPTLLIPGNAAVVRANAQNLADEHTRVADVLEACRAVTTEEALEGGLTSMAYALDRGRLLNRYDGYLTVLDAAHDAISAYAAALVTAQSVAADAITRWNLGESLTAQAVAEHSAAVQAYEAAQCAPVRYQYVGGRAVQIPSVSPSRPGAFVDPGDAVREEARAILDGGRAQLLAAARTALTALGAPGEDDDDRKNSRSGDVDWLGADGSLEGPSISWDFWERTFGDGEKSSDAPFKITLGKIEGGVYVFNAKGEFENFYGDVRVNGDGSVTVLGADGSAQATIDKEGVRINADGTLTILGAEGSIHGSLGPAELGMTGEVLVGARGEGDITIGKNGIHGGGELFAGAKIELTAEGDIGGVGGEVRGEGWLGFGVAGDAEFTFKDGKVTVGVDGGAAFLLGGKAGGEVTLDVPEIVGHGQQLSEMIFGD